MKTMPVGDFKAQFSDVLEKVKLGESFGITYGKQKKTIAMIVPFKKPPAKAKRKIGLLDGKTRITFARDFDMSEEEFLGIP